MTAALSPETQAILLLTAPLIAGRERPSTDLLSPGEYKRLVRHLRDLKREPADLLATDRPPDLLRSCALIVEEGRLQRLLGRGFLLSQAVERWQTRAIWVAGTADSNYPRRLKVRLGEAAPAVMYGCGDLGLLDAGGLAMVGSRGADDEAIDYATNLGRLVAKANRSVISGGARGIDQAAMHGALEEGGKAIGVLADSLEKAAMNRQNRDVLVNGRLLLLSPYDPNAGFNVGNAMQRNKLIYGLADAGLVISSDFEKGGTWAGAIEQLDRLRLVPVYVRSAAVPSAGIDALRKKGAAVWPNPEDAQALDAVLEEAISMTRRTAQVENSLFSDDETPGPISRPASEAPGTLKPLPQVDEAKADIERRSSDMSISDDRPRTEAGLEEPRPDSNFPAPTATSPADELYAKVRQLLQELLAAPMNDAEVAEALQISKAQARAWLLRLVDEDVLEKRKTPQGYMLKRRRLFD